MRFLVRAELKDAVKEWILSRHTPGNRSRWFPFFTMPDGSAAIMANIEPADAVAFALTFEHEILDT